MRLVVVLPGKPNLTSAGVRIRYLRLHQHLEDSGLRLEICLIDSLDIDSLDASDFVLLSKCVDTRGVLLAELLQARGFRVGIDVFDDYFSQRDDSRILHFRRWFCDTLPRIDFVTCATEPMAQRLRALAPKLPLHLINDPVGDWRPNHVARRVSEKRDMVIRDRSLSICWYGMGGNEFFPIGLDDLCAFSGHLAALRRSGLEVMLTVLTNRQAMTADALAGLARLPVPHLLSEWSLEAEEEVLDSSFAAFLPVNAQPFSTVKSMNRAVTAFSHGAQVLTAGYPLYALLNPFIYDDAPSLLRELERGDLRVGEDRINALDDRLKEYANPAREARRLIKFLRGLPRSRPTGRKAGPLAVLHGSLSPQHIHTFAKAHQVLSIDSPVSEKRKNADVTIVDKVDNGCAYLKIGRAARRFAAAQKGEPMGRTAGHRKSWVRPLRCAAMMPDLRTKSTVELFGSYGAQLEYYVAELHQAFPGIRLVLSEALSPLRLSTDPECSDGRALAPGNKTDD